MPDPRSSASYENINEAVKDEWKAETTPAERVKDVIRSTYTPTSAETVADEALTTAKTARKHLETLADDGFVTTSHGPHGATLYQRSADSLIVERANRLRSELSADELAARVIEMRDEIQQYRTQYGVESPEDLAIKLGRETLASDDPDTRTDRSDVTEWQTTRRNLAFANAALSIAEAIGHVTGTERPSSTSAATSQ